MFDEALLQDKTAYFSPTASRVPDLCYQINTDID